jgi:hypothetical protein
MAMSDSCPEVEKKIKQQIIKVMRIHVGKKFLILAISLLLLDSAPAMVRRAVGSGNWGSGSTWSPSGVPACGDTVIIDVGFEVHVNNQQNYTSCSQPMVIHIYGGLMFHKGTKIRMPCNSYVIVYSGGTINHDQGQANSNFIEICGKVEWNSNSQTNGPFCLPPNAPPSFCAALPVELISFRAAHCGESKVCLSWETASERNNDYFEAQRSKNAMDFSVFQIVVSKANGGNSNHNISYSCADYGPLSQNNYYRIKQIDFDKTVTYSKIITVQLDSEQGLQFLIYPNSSNGAFTALISGLRGHSGITVLLRDAGGAILYKVLHQATDSSAEIKVTPGIQLLDGFYFCSFIIDEVEHVVKVIVAN